MSHIPDPTPRGLAGLIAVTPAKREPCGHCVGTGRCPIPYCIRCEDAGEHLAPGDCLACCGEG